jgi:hypothetical protein
MKTKLQRHLATIAPQVSIETHWEHDPDARFPDCMMDENPDDWEPWQSEIRATAITLGEERTGSAYLGGTWEKWTDNPAKSNPTISGYENQMTIEALEELLGGLPNTTDGTIAAGQIVAAIADCQRIAQEEYEAQCKEREAEIARLIA